MVSFYITVQMCVAQHAQHHTTSISPLYYRCLHGATSQWPCKHTSSLILCADVIVTGMFLYPFHVLFSAFADCDGDTLNRALVQYTFDEEEHIIISGPHGNAKKGSTYFEDIAKYIAKAS